MTLSFDPDDIHLVPGHHINGVFYPAIEGIELHRPSDGQIFAHCPIADAVVVDQAVEAAQHALATSGWGNERPRLRAKAMHAWADLIVKNAEELAQIEAVASTRLIVELIQGDIDVSAEQIRFFAEFADKEGGIVAPTASDALGMILTESYGVVGAITPWNVPLSMAAWKLGPALAAGNAVVIKPSEITPFSTLYLVKLAEQAGIPKGIINVVLGNGPITGAAIVGHPGITKVSFTGSTGAGEAIMANIAQTGIKPMTLELGGKSPQLVFQDANLDRAVTSIGKGILANAGQVCIAGSRVLAHRSILPELIERLTAQVQQIKPGPTWDAGSTFSPIISETQCQRIQNIIDQSVRQGAEIVVGGQRMDRPGYFYQPTIVTGAATDNPAVVQEIFGPVLTVESFETEDEALALADHPTYGLCAGLHTQDLSRAMRVTRKLQSGTVWVNRYGRSRDHILPTGGYKASGLGKDLGRQAYQANRREKSVLIEI